MLEAADICAYHAHIQEIALGIAMTHVGRGLKKAVNMTLSEELVREARGLTPNLSETVERLLVDYVAAERAKRADFERRIDESIAMINAHYEEHGYWGEEFSTL
jgi:antitoxin CcdA